MPNFVYSSIAASLRLAVLMLPLPHIKIHNNRQLFLG